MGHNKDFSRKIIEKMKQAYALHKVIYTDSGQIADLEFIDVNQAFAQAVEVPRHQLVGHRIREIVSFNNHEAALWIKFVTGFDHKDQGTLNGHCRFRNRFFDVERFSPEEGYYLLVAHDVTELENSREALKSHAYYDRMTNLPNRVNFRETVKNSLKLIEGTHVVAYLDIDSFKEINDQYGHDIGDKLLCEVAERLGLFANKDVVVARTSGDEFSLLIKNVQNMEAVWHLCGQIRNSVASPIHFEDYWFSVTVCIGFAKGYGHITSAKQLMRWADIAVHRAKKTGTNVVLAYDATMLKMIDDKFEIKELLRRAVKDQSFTLLYQPQFALDQEEISGFEALIRLKDASGHFISPLKFIPVAEESNLIHQLGEWVLREACRQLKLWQASIDGRLTMSVNVSAVQLRHEDFSQRAMSIISGSGVAPGSLELEITETAILNNDATVISQIKELNEFGVRIALDDFGTGYSSLSHLLELPIDIVKVDKIFVEQIEEQPDKAKIVGALIQMMAQIGKKVIAEGVETEGQLEFLKKCQCDLVQGYYYAKPLPAHQAKAMVEEKNRLRERHE